MRVLPILIALAVLGSPVTGSTELLRIEVGRSRSGVPMSFNELEANARGMTDVTVTWTTPPTYNAWYSSYGGANAGSLSLTDGAGETYQVNWALFDDPGAAQQWVQEQLTWAGGYSRYAVEGRVVVNVYVYSGNGALADAMLAGLSGR